VKALKPWERPIIHVEKHGTMTKSEYSAQTTELGRPINWRPRHKGYPSALPTPHVDNDSNYRIADPYQEVSK
jgi:hypothetical protein